MALFISAPDRPTGELRFSNFIDYLAIPSNLDLLVRRPWTMITYMFLHVQFLHILFNLLWLYWFGLVFVQELGLKKLLSTYLLGGLAGGLLFVFAYNTLPVFKAEIGVPALGASASVMAVVVAAATYRPERKMHLVFIGPVKIGYIALAMFIFSSLLEFSLNTGGKIAHIGGALLGFFFAYYYKRGKDISRGFDRMMDRIASWFKPRQPKMKVTHKRPVDDMEYNQQKAEDRKNLDEILDKISKGGYESLTAREKEILFRMGEKK
jgi:membrane associated rhomboid family serine protease